MSLCFGTTKHIFSLAVLAVRQIYAAKVEEQNQRHQRYHGNSAIPEPDMQQPRRPARYPYVTGRSTSLALGLARDEMVGFGFFNPG